MHVERQEARVATFARSAEDQHLVPQPSPRSATGKIKYYCQMNEMIAGRDGSSQIKRRECSP